MTPDELRTRVARDYPDADWHEECAGLVYYVCRVTGDVRAAYPSATAARRASEIVSTDPTRAPVGAVHYWSYPARIGGVYADWGHTAVDVYGAGWALMSDPEDDQATWGTNLGVTNVVDWTQNRRGIVTYLGWSRTYGVNTPNITPPIPIPTPPKEDAMKPLLVRIDSNTDGRWLVVDTTAGTYYESPNQTQRDFLINVGAVILVHGEQPPAIIDGYRRTT